MLSAGVLSNGQIRTPGPFRRAVLLSGGRRSAQRTVPASRGTPSARIVGCTRFMCRARNRTDHRQRALYRRHRWAKPEAEPLLRRPTLGRSGPNRYRLISGLRTGGGIGIRTLGPPATVSSVVGSSRSVACEGQARRFSSIFLARRAIPSSRSPIRFWWVAVCYVVRPPARAAGSTRRALGTGMGA
jgi:hypothetical protein